MSTLALDLGTKLGYAIERASGYGPSGQFEHGSASFAIAPHEGDGIRFLRFRAWLHAQKARLDLLADPLDRVFFERVDFMVPGQVYAAHVWGAFWGTLTAWAAHHDLACTGIATGTLKKAATGSGRAKKPEIIKAIRARGFRVADHNEADAIALLLAAGTRLEAA